MNGNPTGILTIFPGSKTRCITPDIANPYCSRAPRPVDGTGEAAESPQTNERRRENWRGVAARQVRDRETGTLYATCQEAAFALGMSVAAVKRECLKGERLEWEAG